MNTKALAAAGAVLALTAVFTQADPMGTAFTYQGRLCDGGVPANGLYDLQFALYDAASLGNPQGVTSATNGVAVTNGLFTVFVDFGATVFGGGTRWMEISARTNGVGTPVALGPRQELKPAPYALYAPNAGVAATASTVAAGSVNTLALAPGAVDSSRIADGTLTAADLSPTLASNTFWRLDGNAGTTAGTQFVGTTDNQPLELKVKGTRALRIEPSTDGGATVHPNLTAGAPDNTVAGGHGSSIGGGWSNTLSNAPAAFLGGGTLNAIRNAEQGFIGGGSGNRIEASLGAAIGGGVINYIDSGASYSIVGGGQLNAIEANSSISTIGGGNQNKIKTEAYCATIAGGDQSIIYRDADFATIGGGRNNYILTNSDHATIAGGRLNRIAQEAPSAAIAGGERNQIGDGSVYSFLGGGSNNLILSEYGNGYSVLGGGQDNRVESSHVFLGGGYRNTNACPVSFLGGGGWNSIESSYGGSVLVGGVWNKIESASLYSTPCSFIGGGQWNAIRSGSDHCFIGGGQENTILSTGGTIGGGVLNYIGTNIYSDGPVAFTNWGNWSFIGGGHDNGAYGLYATVAAGRNNEAYGDHSAVGGGSHNLAGSPQLRSANAAGATVAGGIYNEAGARNSTVGGGTNNHVMAQAASIPGGQDALADNYGQVAHASGSFDATGDAQTSVRVLRGSFIGNTLTNELFLDGGANDLRMFVRPNTTWAYDILVVARSAGAYAGGWHLRGVIENNGGTVSAPLPLKNVLANDFNGDAVVGADNANKALVIKVWNGDISYRLRWVATVRTAEVTFP